MKKYISIIFVFIVFVLSGCYKDKTSSEINIDNSSSKKASTYRQSSGIEKNLSNSLTRKENTTQNETLPTENSESYSDSKDRHIISFTPICQYPELPTGCEVTSLAMVLNYYNVDCDKCEISDNYLTKGAVGTVDFHQAFEGDPRDEHSYGCYANVIVETANKIIADKGAILSVNDFTDTPLENLYAFIDNDIPVIVWGTQDCQEGHFSVTWNVNGQDLTWFTPEHCMVLIGYDKYSVWVADPIYGDIRSYDKVTFEGSYNSLFKQAVIIKSVGVNINSTVSEMRE